MKIYYTSAAIGFQKVGNVLFNDALNTFYLRLYGIRTYGKEKPLR